MTTAIARVRALNRACLSALKLFSKDVGHGLLEVSHNSLALLGLCVVGAALFAGTQEGLRGQIERHALDWLQARHEAREPVVEKLVPDEPGAVARATAADPKSLPRQQAAVASWISRRYSVAPEPISRLVQEAWTVGERAGLEPTLILAVMAVESSFNPFAHSPVGAQGLMQVMTKIHDDKYEAFGGTRAAFDPLTNLRVGVQVLRDCIARAGGLEMGLKHYVGAANHGMDGGYAAKVLMEQAYLKRVAEGKPVPTTASLQVPATALSSAPSAAPAAVQPARTAPMAPASAPEAPADERVALLTR